MNTRLIGKAAAFVACVVVAACALVGCAAGGAAAGGDAVQGITVSASSETKVVPDKARIRVSIVTEDAKPEACQSKNSEATNKVIEALGGLGVEDTSIQTSYSDLSPRYGSRSSDSAKDDEAYDEWVITSYEMTTMLTVSDLEIDNVGPVVQACVAAGANGTDGVEYYASSYDEKYNEALAAALETAKSKADRIAEATGSRVGKVLSVTEGYQDTSARYAANDMAYEEVEAAGASAAKTMPGQIGITAQVTVTYAIS